MLKIKQYENDEISKVINNQILYPNYSASLKIVSGEGVSSKTLNISLKQLQQIKDILSYDINTDFKL